MKSEINRFMSQKERDKEGKAAVIGLGYVGLPIALELAAVQKVIGFDIDADKVDLLRNSQDPSGEMEPAEFDGKDILFTTDPEHLKEADFFIVSVPTPIDESRQPDLHPLLKASELVGRVLKKGDHVVYESTVYPGCTEEECIPLLEKHSGLTYKTDFKVGYSPERINPGDTRNTLRNIVKVVSGCDAEALERIAEFYERVVDAGVFRAASIKVAEAAKVIENTQRDVNIALVNELSIIFDKVGINTYDVLEAAATKWNFLNFYPGLVGGHCIGVDPYYLTHKARKVGYHAKIINSGRYVNDSMGFYIGKQTIKEIIAKEKNVLNARVLVMGATFKKDVSDIRNSKVVDLVREMESFGATVDVVDPYASSKEVEREYGFSLQERPGTGYDAVVITIDHTEYKEMEEEDLAALLDEEGIVVDVKGIFKDRIHQHEYMSL